MNPFLRYTALIFILTVSTVVFSQKTALLIIDIQEVYFPGGGLTLENPEEAGMNAGLLLQHFRQTGQFVIHVKHNVNQGGNIHEFVVPIEKEQVIVKDDINAFKGTPLREILEKNGVERLVICGMQTHMCVEAATRAASDMGYSCIVVSDACTTRALQYGPVIVPAKEVHYSTLSTLAGYYADVLTTDEYLRSMVEASHTAE